MVLFVKIKLFYELCILFDKTVHQKLFISNVDTLLRRHVLISPRDKAFLSH